MLLLPVLHQELSADFCLWLLHTEDILINKFFLASRSIQKRHQEKGLQVNPIQKRPTLGYSDVCLLMHKFWLFVSGYDPRTTVIQGEALQVGLFSNIPWRCGLWESLLCLMSYDLMSIFAPLLLKNTKINKDYFPPFERLIIIFKMFFSCLNLSLSPTLEVLGSFLSRCFPQQSGAPQSESKHQNRDERLICFNQTISWNCSPCSLSHRSRLDHDAVCSQLPFVL